MSPTRSARASNENAMPVLSICIPTYNRAEFLRELLDSLLEARDHIHVAISDNASTDETPEIVRAYAERLDMDYDRSETNLGPDRNYLRAAAMSRSAYTMICGSDDVFPAGGVSRIVALLRDEPDILVYEKMDCDYRMNPIRPRKYMATEKNNIRYEFSQDNDAGLLRYLADCTSIGGVYSYLTSVVIRTERWSGVKCPDILLGTAYPHVYFFLEIIKQGAVLKYEASPLVHCRTGNDTFRRDDLVDRLMVDVDGYQMVAEACFPNGARMQAALRRVVFVEHMGYLSSIGAVALARSGTTQEKWERYLRNLAEGMPLPGRFLLGRLVPRPAVRILNRARRMLASEWPLARLRAFRATP